ncbi:MAG: arginine N-succinyltransferase [Phycisphaerales bacterium]|nr:arginine N-succinyltransferase [Phycisphaerales bacterium]
MFLIRRARPDDLPTLLKLAKMVHFINLPADKDIINEKIARSTASFQAAAAGLPPPEPGPSSDKSAAARSPIFMFVVEDVETGNPLGTSMIIARMGLPGSPNVAFELSEREFYSRDLKQGAKHITAKLFLDESGKTEIGGLILTPNSRGHPAKIGKQISLIRFHYMGLHRDHFASCILAEMMAPITPDGRNTLWEYLGRRFINLSYTEADKFCQYSREFMTSLLPREEIYLTLLPPEARALVGQVGPDTVPARRMLEDLGFHTTSRVDPFDGGPHLEADTDSLPLVRDTRRLPLLGACSAGETNAEGFLSADHEDGDFRAAFTRFHVSAAGVKAPKKVLAMLGAEPGQTMGLTEFDIHGDKRSKRQAPAKGRRKKAAAAG